LPLHRIRLLEGKKVSTLLLRTHVVLDYGILRQLLTNNTALIR